MTDIFLSLFCVYDSSISMVVPLRLVPVRYDDDAVGNFLLRTGKFILMSTVLNLFPQSVTPRKNKLDSLSAVKIIFARTVTNEVTIF